jgi:hypothetical protein
MPLPYSQLVPFLASKLRHELGFRVPIFFPVFLIIRLFGFIPHPYITYRQYKDAKITLLKHVLRHYLYEAGCSGHYQMQKWWTNSQPLSRHQFLEVMFNLGYFKPRVFKPLFDTARHGLSNSKFHKLCDNKGPTMTVYTLNGKMVVAILQRSWNVLDCGWNFDPDLRLFFVHNDGTTTELECTNSKEQLNYYNGCLSGPHFGGLPLDFRSQRTEVHFCQRELITGGPRIYHASIDSVVVLQMGGSALPPLPPHAHLENCHIEAKNNYKILWLQNYFIK